MKKYLLSCLLFTVNFGVYAEIVSIPLEYTGSPAKDLVGDNGKVMSILEAKRLYRQTKDLSQLDPKENDVWKNNVGKKLSKADDDFHISDKEVFSYVDKVISTIGSYRFIVREQSEGSAKRNLNIWVSKDSRSILLRKNILRKLGYIVPKIQHLKQMKIQFRGAASMKAFLDELSNGTFADSDRWRIHTDEEKHIITLQDVLVLESNTKIYNLAMGDMNDDTVGHRRVINALSLPYALVDLRESVDGFTWSVGRQDNKVVLFDIFSGDMFSTTYFDAMWMMKRLTQLTREDYKEVVDYAYFPHSVGTLLVEKLIARMNSLKRLFLNSKNLLAVKNDISDDTGELVRGRLTQDNWEGHAARYSFDDTESPLSKDEMVAYFKSKVYSGVIENLVGYLNDNYLYATDIQEAAIKKAIEAQNKQFENLFQTGKFEKIPFSAWAIPTAKGNIIASRDIVTGAYLGTDNTIQIADSLEFLGEVGVFVGTLGMPTNVQMFGTGNARFSRSYTHVKSIKSIKTALKEPYRNIIVPMVKRKKARTIIQMIDDLQSEEFANLEGDERQARISEIFNELNEVLEMGDSLIISNNLIFGANGILGYKFPFEGLNISALINMNARKVNLWRLHITRSGDNTFQVYKSKASSLGAGFGFQARAIIPIVSLSFDGQNGSISTNFHTIDLDKNEETSETIKKLVQLRQVLVENSTELMTKAKKPFVIKHKFKEDTVTAQMFYMQGQTAKLVDKLKITHPDGYDTDFYIRNIARLKGTNYMQVVYDLLNGIIEEVLDEDNVSLSNAESGNPGDSFYGQSFSRQTTIEVPFNDEDSEIPFENYSQVRSQWKGWSASRSKLTEIKNFINEKYGKDIFNEEKLYDTNKIKLYTVNVTLSIYAAGLQNMMDYNHHKLMRMFTNEAKIPWPKHRSRYIRRANGRRHNVYERKRRLLIAKVREAHSRLHSDFRNVLDPQVKSKDIALLVDSLEAMLPFERFEEIIGGDEFYYLNGSINGFRVGIENGEEAIVSHALGEFGSEFQGGISDTLRNAIKISQGELGAYWFLRRIQQ